MKKTMVITYRVECCPISRKIVSVNTTDTKKDILKKFVKELRNEYSRTSQPPMHVYAEIGDMTFGLYTFDGLV